MTRVKRAHAWLEAALYAASGPHASPARLGHVVPIPATVNVTSLLAGAE